MLWVLFKGAKADIMKEFTSEACKGRKNMKLSFYFLRYLRGNGEKGAKNEL